MSLASFRHHHQTLDEVVEILLQESPLVRNVVTMGKLFFSRDGSTLEADALADMISSQPQFSMAVGSMFMALNSVVLVSDGLVALHGWGFVFLFPFAFLAHTHTSIHACM